MSSTTATTSCEISAAWVQWAHGLPKGLGVSLIVVGIVLIIAGAAAYKKSRAAFASLFVVGLLLAMFGGLGIVYPASEYKPPAQPQRPPTTLTALAQASSVSTPPPPPFALQKATVPAYAVSPVKPIPTPTHTQTQTQPPQQAQHPQRKVLQWADRLGESAQPRRESTSQQRHIGEVREFWKEDPPVNVSQMPSTPVPDHVPKPVPARPTIYRYGYQPGYVEPETVADIASVIDQRQNVLAEGPQYYSPGSAYQLTIDELADERNRFWQRPETPELARSRRVNMLREIAATLPAPRMSVAVAGNPVGP